MGKPNSFMQLKVRKAGSTEQPLILTFLSNQVRWETEQQCLKEGFEIVDASPGYQIFHDYADAMTSVRVFCRV